MPAFFMPTLYICHISYVMIRLITVLIYRCLKFVGMVQ